MLTGNNGIVNKAQYAAKQTEIAQDIEKLKLFYSDIVLEKRGKIVGYDEYLDYLEENNVPTQEEDGNYYAEERNRIYKIEITDNSLNIEYVKDGNIKGPRITKIDVTAKTNSSIAIKATAIRMEGGTYTYYISTDNKNFGEAKGTNTTGNFEFTGLNRSTTYYIKVVGKTKDGEGSKTIEEKIIALPDAEGNIKYKIAWNDGSATIEFSTESEYIIETSLDNEKYKKTSKQEGLKNGDVVYARLTKNNMYGKEMAVTITDNTAPQIALELAKETSKSVTIKATATDDESGISGQTYSFYKATSMNDLSSATIDGTSNTGEYTFDNLDQNTTYYIKVEISDNAGNKATSNITSKTNLIPAAETAITRNINWNADKTAKVELSTKENYTIQYRTNSNSQWQNYTGIISVQNGTNIYIVLTDGKNYGEDYTINIQDNDGPNVKIEKGEITTNSIKVNVTATDAGAGMPVTPTYNYYIKKEGENDYKLIAENQTSNEYTFTELQDNTTYNIKVTTKDLLGNEGTGEETYATPELKYQSGNITISGAIWNNKIAKVTITNNSNYNMQYKVIPEGESITLAEGMITESSKTKEVGNLKNNYTIIARLYDGTNYSDEYAQYQVKDSTAPKINVAGISNEWQNKDVVLTINAEDTESGLTGNCYSFDNGENWQAKNSKTYTENTNGIVIKVKDIAGNISTYPTINITNIDKIGPEITTSTKSTSKELTVNVTKITDAGAGLGETTNVTYKFADTEEGLKTAKGEQVLYKEGETTKTYTGLQQSTTYYIQVETQDKLGNTTSKIFALATGSLNADTGSLKIADVAWKNEKASTTITNESEYQMQYQVVKSGATYDKNKNWQDTTEKNIEASELENGDTIYARLTDGKNYSSEVIKTVKDEVAPTLNVIGNPTEWTNNDVTLTINANDNESGLAENAYSFDGGTTWQKENTKTYTENTNGIVIKVKDKAENITTYNTIDITKIDKTGPNLTIEKESNTSKQITVKVSSNDELSGMPKTPTYTYYLKGENDKEYTKTITTTDTSYTYENLKSGTYSVKVEAQDNIGNIGVGTTTISTETINYVTGDITFSDIIWSNSYGTVKATNNREYEVEYQIGKNQAKLNINGTWNLAKQKTFEINNLEEGDIVYARLTDEVNSSVGYVTLNITNNSVKKYSQEELAKNTTRSNFDILGISAANNEIKVQIDGEKEGAKLYNYYYKTINDTDYTLISTSTYGYDPAVIKNVKEGAIYQIKATYIDSNGNVQRSQNTATVIALNNAETGKTYTDNRTYIDKSKELAVSKTAGTGKVTPGNTEQVLAGYTVTVPETFKISAVNGENKESEGVILQDGSDNEYVWIPVNDVIYDGITQMPTSSGTASRTYKPMAKQDAEGNYESLRYTFNGSNSWRNDDTNSGNGKRNYREPSLLTGSVDDGYTWNISNAKGNNYDASSENYKDILGFNNIGEFGKYENNSYTNMILGVDNFGGFYVGRYETSQTTDASGNIVVGSKSNAKPLSIKNWYNLALYQDSNKYTSNPYSKISSVTSSMIWQTQWDTMLNYILKGNDKNKVTVQVGEQKREPSNSGQDSSDKINNIYDLGSNLYEFTKEAYGTQNRIIRGGSYDTATKNAISDKTADTPTDMGEGIGSRLALYAQSTRDETGPSVSIKNVKANSNNIEVEVDSIDRESGVENYKYFISENGNDYTLAGTSTSSTYTYTGLKNNTKYYLKISAVDKAKNEGNAITQDVTTTNLGATAKDGITLSSISGTNGEGRANLVLDTKYTSLGYYIEYQVGSHTDGKWTKGDEISGLSNGQTIYATIYDGINRSTDYFEYEVSGLEQFEYYVDESGNSTENTTVKYTDSEGNVAYIPQGFKVGVTDTINKIHNGLVIQDTAENEFVWVPVENAIETDTSKTSTEKAMARLQTGYPNNSGLKYYEGIRYDFSGTTSTKKYNTPIIGKTVAFGEPRLVTGGADYTWNIENGQAKGSTWDTLEQYYKKMDFRTNNNVNVFGSYSEFGSYMNEQYTKMIKSVDNYKGFYVGRYETSLNGSGVNAVAQSKLGQNPIYNQSWYKDYYYQDNNLDSTNPYHSNKAVTSSMIWGSQWDAIMNWMLADKNTASFITTITGNHSGKMATTGSYTNDLAKNIFDLSSNVTEWTQGNGANAQGWRAQRGGYAVDKSDKYYSYTAISDILNYSAPYMPCVYYGQNDSTQYGCYMLGSRMSLYVNNQTDTTEAEANITNVEAGTNNVNIKVEAKDDESGIQNYTYTLYNDSNYKDLAKQEKVYSNSYTLSGLNQNQTYYLQVQVTNGSGLVKTINYGQIKTEILNVKDGDIVVEKTWGKNTKGKIYCVIKNEDLKNQGYYIEYQKIASNGTFNVNGTWTKSDTPSNLSEGDKVYLRLSDGTNKSTYYMVANITELEKFSDTYTETAEYIDKDGNKAYIPAGFKVSKSSLTNTINNGLVIEDDKENQYVWIPVEHAIYDKEDGTIPNNYSNASKNASPYKPMVKYQKGYDKNSKEQYFEGIAYTGWSEGNKWGSYAQRSNTDYALGQGSYREPTLVTGSTQNYSWISVAGGQYDAQYYSSLSGLGIDSPTSMGKYLNNSYTASIQSIDKYKGFYVGRYETSIFTSTGTNDYNKGTIVGSRENETPMASVNWYKMYLSEDSNYADNPYHNSTSVVSQMITGSEYDAMLNYILLGSDSSKVYEITGNHTNSRSKTGQFGSDIMNNIFDLSSNVREWTSEADGALYRVDRGGYYYIGSMSPAHFRNYNYPTNIFCNIGSRFTLYVK